MLDAFRFGDVCHEFPFRFLFDVFNSDNFVRKVVCDSKESINSLQCCFEGGFRRDVALLEDNIVSKVEKGLRGRFIDVASQCTDLYL